MRISIMKEAIQKIVLIVITVVLLFLLYRWAMTMKESGSPYISFPNKIETFK